MSASPIGSVAPADRVHPTALRRRSDDGGAEQDRAVDEGDRVTEPGPASGGERLTEAEQREVRELAARDREVRAHEMAHVAAGGAHVTSGPSYSFRTGPDGKRYAVGGEVGIDTSPEEDPEATIAKMAQVRAAALAPAAIDVAMPDEHESAPSSIRHDHGGGACPRCVGIRYAGSEPSPVPSVLDVAV